MYPHLLYGGLLRAGWVSYLVLGMLRLKKKRPVPAPEDLQGLQVVEVSKV